MWILKVRYVALATALLTGNATAGESNDSYIDVDLSDIREVIYKEVSRKRGAPPDDLLIPDTRQQAISTLTVNPFDEVGEVKQVGSNRVLMAEPIPVYSRRATNMDSPLTGSRATHGTARQGGGLTTTRRPTASDYDPFNTLIQWDWKSNVSVGKAVQALARVAGYTLIIRDQRVGNVYALPLPYAHRRVSSIDVKTGLEFLGGPGLMVVVDHTTRTIMHVVKAKYLSAHDLSSLSRCEDNVSFAVMPAGRSSDRVIIVEDEQCVY